MTNAEKETARIRAMVEAERRAGLLTPKLRRLARLSKTNDYANQELAFYSSFLTPEEKRTCKFELSRE